VKVLVVAEYYPRAADPVLGVWAHRQALAAREAGAEVRVLVLHRVVPPRSAVRSRDIRRALAIALQPTTAELDGLEVRYVRYLSPPRRRSYASWGAWAAPALRRALRGVRAGFAFDLVHAHYAVPAGDTVRRATATAQVPLVVSVHSHDPLGGGGENARATLKHARLVIANSAGTARRCADAGARKTRVVHLGADVPAAPRDPPRTPTLVTVAHLIERKRHADVISALALLRSRHPTLRYVIVGDGPERERISALAASLGVHDEIELRGQLAPARAIAAAREGSIFVLPSVDEALGVAYLEAMAAGVPAIGCRGEDGPEEIGAAGGGIVLIPPRDAHALAAEIDALLRDPARLEATGSQARATVQRAFTWQRCGRETVAAYHEALGT
jgi:teichuronic acid biosynthesis glycosyltransferase TuaC